MHLNQIIKKLYKEGVKLDRLIASLEQIEASAAGRQAKPPKKRRGRKSMDAKARLEVSLRMKKYWASRRKSSMPGA